MPRAKKEAEEIIPEQPPVDNEHVEEGAEQFPEPETTPEAVDNTDTTAPSEVQEVTKSTQASFDIIFEDGSVIRTYSVEIHGENAEALANEFVASHPGTKVQ